MSRSINRIELRVEAIRDLSPSLKHLRLVPAQGQGQLLAPASAGSHIVLTLRDASRTFRNAYSLTSKPGARDAYEIIVRRVQQSRGGSDFIHREIAPGTVLEATPPANLFAPVRTARRHLLIAAGVGIPTCLNSTHWVSRSNSITAPATTSRLASPVGSASARTRISIRIWKNIVWMYLRCCARNPWARSFTFADRTH